MSCACGCCEVASAPVPVRLANRSGLTAVSYRAGTFGTFRRAIVHQLSRPGGLPGLTARGPEDYAIATVEMWCAVADVLTFYAERLVNEGYLRTATLSESVRRLVGLIDYLPARGAAATARLAFTLEDGAAALVPRGTRVASVPAEGETPQVYETLADVVADARLNRLRVHPPPAPKVPTDADATTAIVAPDADALAAAAALARGDRVLVYDAIGIEMLTLTDVTADEDALHLRWALPLRRGYPSAAEGDSPDSRAYRLGRTFRPFGWDLPATVSVTLPQNAANPFPRPATAVPSFALHGDATILGTVALDGHHPGLGPGSVLIGVRVGGGATTVVPLLVDALEERRVERPATSTQFAGGSTSTTPHVARVGTATVVKVSPLTGRSLETLAPTNSDDIRDLEFHEALGPPLRLWPYAFAERVPSDVAHIAGRRSGWLAIEVGRTLKKGVPQPGVVLDAATLPPGREVFLTDAGGDPIAATGAGAAIVGMGVSIRATATDRVTISQIGLGPDRAVPATVLMSRPHPPAGVKFAGSRRELTVRIGALPPQTIALGTGATTVALTTVAAALQAAIRAALPGEPAFAGAMALVLDARIVVAPGTPGAPVEIGPTAADVTTVADMGLRDGDAGWLDGVIASPAAAGQWTVSGTVEVQIGLRPATTVALAGNGSGLFALRNLLVQAHPGIRVLLTPDGRLLVLPGPPAREPRAFLRVDLRSDGARVLDPAGAALLGNVAPAGHGETVRDEVLGDGDASRPFQAFDLAKAPLTLTPAATPGGVASSLHLMVAGVEWEERRSLFGAGPDDHVYVTRADAAGRVRIMAGDGTTGARLLTGRRNVAATYRRGIGLAARVRAEQLTTLRDRPTGVKRVVNPLPSDGGADPETAADARLAAPGSVRTFGRAVSLRDFEDGALLAGEVAKAAATWVWTGERRAVHLTVAGHGGARFSPEGLARIRAALATERDPNHRLLIDNHLPMPVTVDATVTVDARHRTDAVLAACRAAIVDALAFPRLRFAQSVALSHVMAVLQAVDGVEAVDVNTLDYARQTAAVRADHGVGPNDPQPLERLRMLPARPAPGGGVNPAELARLDDPSRDLVLRAVGGLS